MTSALILEEKKVELLTKKIKELEAENSMLKDEKKSWKRYKFISNSADQFLTMINRDYIYETANSAYCKTKGLRPEDILGRSVSDVWGRDQFEGIIKKNLDSCFNGNITYTEDWFDFGKDELNCYQVTYHPYKNRKGAVTHAVVVTHDITQTRLAEKELRKAHDRLEKRVKIRTNELEAANEKLRKEIIERTELENKLWQSQKMEAIGTLAGGIAHDFNNLLMGIQGNISLIDLQMDTADLIYDYIRSIEHLVESGGNLTRQLLGFARGGKYVVKPVNINHVVLKTSEMFSRTRKTASVKLNCRELIQCVEADEGQIEQVLLNLFMNAWQAMDEKGDIFIETSDVQLDHAFVEPFNISPGAYINVSVTDTGKGIEGAIKNRIFEPFFTTKEMGCGSGLGLASVFGIVKNHGGMVNFISETGKGSTFSIYLPITDKAVENDKREDVRILKGIETVLLVDDETYIIETCGPMLEKMGYTVLSAGCGTDAITIFRENCESIDLVILDMLMPGMSGGDVYYHIKALKKDVLVILASGCGIGDVAPIMESGCDGFLQKPFSMKQLSHSIRDVFDHR